MAAPGVSSFALEGTKPSTTGISHGDSLVSVFLASLPHFCPPEFRARSLHPLLTPWFLQQLATAPPLIRDPQGTQAGPWH